MKVLETKPLLPNEDNGAQQGGIKGRRNQSLWTFLLPAGPRRNLGLNQERDHQNCHCPSYYRSQQLNHLSLMVLHRQ